MAGSQAATNQIIGLYFDVTVSGAEISGGNAYVCTSRDAQGACHGVVLSFIPH